MVFASIDDCASCVGSMPLYHGYNLVKTDARCCMMRCACKECIYAAAYRHRHSISCCSPAYLDTCKTVHICMACMMLVAVMLTWQVPCALRCAYCQ